MSYGIAAIILIWIAENMAKKKISGSMVSKDGNISTVITNTIIQKLLERELQPGDKLPSEPELSAEFGVGRNTIREALKMLSVFGVIEVKKGIGTYITTSLNSAVFNPLILSIIYDQDKQRDFFEYRFVYEVSVIELALKRIDKQEVKRLRANNKKILALAEDADVDNTEKIRKLDFDFHVMILEFTGNPFFIKQGMAIYSLFYNSIGSLTRDDVKYTFEHHKMIIDAIEEDNAEAIREAVWASSRFWLDYLD